MMMAVFGGSASARLLRRPEVGVWMSGGIQRCIRTCAKTSEHVQIHQNMCKDNDVSEHVQSHPLEPAKVRASRIRVLHK